MASTITMNVLGVAMAMGTTSTLRLFTSKPSRSLLFVSSISFQPLRSSLNPNPQISSPPSPSPSADADAAALPQKLREIVSLFQSVADPKLKYRQLLHYGSQLPPLDPQFKTDDYRVRGCVSQVWVRAFVDPEDPSAVRFEADSDSALTKGLAALLVFGLSGSPAPEIARVPPDFVQLLGLRQSLTPSRNNGFLNMLRLMQRKGLELYGAGGSEVQGVDSGAKDVSFDRKESILNGNSDGDSSVKDVGVDKKDSILNGNRYVVESPNGSGSRVSGSDNRSENGSSEDADASVDSVGSHGTGTGSRKEMIVEILRRELSPLELEVEDISYQHAGHAAVRGSGDGETHFNVRIVSKEFEGKSLVKRHRLIYSLLQDELQNGLHALSIEAKTPSEVQSS